MWEICNPFVLISKRSWSDYFRIIGLYYETYHQKAISILLSRLVYFSRSRSLAGSRNVHICRNEKKGRWVKSWILTWISALIRGFRYWSNALARALLMCHLISSQRPGGSCCFGICRQMSFLKYEKLHLLSKESRQFCLSNMDKVEKAIPPKNRWRPRPFSPYFQSTFSKTFPKNGTALMVPHRLILF